MRKNWTESVTEYCVKESSVYYMPYKKAFKGLLLQAFVKELFRPQRTNPVIWGNQNITTLKKNPCWFLNASTVSYQH